MSAHIFLDVIHQGLSFLIIVQSITPRVVTAPGNHNVIFTEMIRQIDCHVYERAGSFLCVELPRFDVRNKRIVWLTIDTLPIDIKELIPWLASVSMNNTCKDLVLVSEIRRERLPNKVHSQFIVG